MLTPRTDRSTSAGAKLAGLTIKQAVDLASYLKSEYGIEPAAGGAVVVTITDRGANTLALTDPAVAKDVERLTDHAIAIAAVGDATLSRSFERTLITLTTGSLDLDRPL